MFARPHLNQLVIHLSIARERLRENQDPGPDLADNAHMAITSIAGSNVPTRQEAESMLRLYTRNLTLRDVEAVIDLIERTLELAD